MSHELLACHSCQAVIRCAAHKHPCCPRCGALMHRRKPLSLTACWALTLAACIMFIPANVLPMLRIGTLGSGQASNLMQGVIDLWSHGMWPLAAIVFTASILVPLMKLIALIYLLISVHFGRGRGARQKTRLYFMTEYIGRWSMIDIYVIAILYALVQFGRLASVEIGAGTFCFASVVILTIFAAESFDPRLIWDRHQTRKPL